MSAVRYVFYTFLIVAMPHKCCGDELELTKYKWPTTVIAVLVRNKAHTLPYFLTSLYNLDYPKDRLYIWITSDYNQDSSDEILSKWSNKYGEEYNGLNITFDRDSGPLHADEENPLHWSPAHFKHVINLREQALNFSRKIWADFLFMVDADAFFTNTAVLKTLVRKNLDIVAPMLISDGLYSNFWCGMTENYYYKRTDDYKPIVSREQKGCFPVPMVHSSVLVNLRSLKSDHLTYNPNNLRDYNGPEDDIITFAVNAKQNGITLSVCNDQIYGFLPVPLEHDDDPANDYEQLLNIKLEATSKGYSLPLDPLLESYVQYPTMWKFNLDEIYLINLERRTERRKLMEQSFKELGMDAKHFKAVDGRNLDINDLSKFSITLMPNYEDPYHERPMKAGEVGCFLSHYMIWQEIIEKGFNTVLILEDDIHFAPYFRHKLLNLLKEIKSLDWDLVYIGRKILQDSKEVYATPHLVRPLYSYWTLGYLISQRGARKLLDAEPLSKMLPVDEFLPIMFDQHPNATWKSYFTLRDLEAYSVAPLLVHPTHYTGQEGYISDTEDSNVVPLDRLDKNVRIEL